MATNRINHDEVGRTLQDSETLLKIKVVKLESQIRDYQKEVFDLKTQLFKLERKLSVSASNREGT